MCYGNFISIVETLKCLAKPVERKNFWIVARVAMETQSGGEIRAFFEYDRNDKKLASMKKQMVFMSWKGHKTHE